MTAGVAVKFCGMTRAEDVRAARELSAEYVGCVFAGGPRHRLPGQARELWTELEPGRPPRRVGVFADDDIESVPAVAAAVGLDVVQIVLRRDGAMTAGAITRLKKQIGLEVWAVLRCHGSQLPPNADEAWRSADALLLDAHASGSLGGTGVTLPWVALAPHIEHLRRQHDYPRRLILAGGLTPENVAGAIGILRPDVVDVSSGVERAPGVKDHSRMRAFIDAVVPFRHNISPPSHPFVP